MKFQCVKNAWHKFVCFGFFFLLLICWSILFQEHWTFYVLESFFPKTEFAPAAHQWCLRVCSSSGKWSPSFTSLAQQACLSCWFVLPESQRRDFSKHDSALLIQVFFNWKYVLLAIFFSWTCAVPGTMAKSYNWAFNFSGLFCIHLCCWLISLSLLCFAGFFKGVRLWFCCVAARWVAHLFLRISC